MMQQMGVQFMRGFEFGSWLCGLVLGIALAVTLLIVAMAAVNRTMEHFTAKTKAKEGFLTVTKFIPAGRIAPGDCVRMRSDGKIERADRYANNVLGVLPKDAIITEGLVIVPEGWPYG